MIELPWLLYVLLGASAVGSLADAALRILRYRREKGQAEADVYYRHSQAGVNVAVAGAMLRAADVKSGDDLINLIERLRGQST